MDRHDDTGRWPTEPQLKAHARKLAGDDAKAIDWDGLLAFILKIIGLFKK
jgi:hypothetical protein